MELPIKRVGVGVQMRRGKEILAQNEKSSSVSNVLLRVIPPIPVSFRYCAASAGHEMPIISLWSRWDYAHGCGPCPAPGELGLLLPREISPTGTPAMAKPTDKDV